MLPGRASLAREYGVALATVERAVAALLADGTLSASGGRGTFVASRESVPGDVVGASERRPAGLGMLGILCTLAPASTWNVIVIDNVERRHSAAGGSCQFLERGYPDGSAMSLEEAAAKLVERGCTAIVLDALHIGGHGEPDDLQVPVPLVRISARSMRAPSLNVYYDNYEAGYHAAKHLLDGGSRDLLFVAPFETPWGDERIAGARAAVAAQGASRLRRSPVGQVPMEHVRSYKQFPQFGYDAVQGELETDFGPLGVIAANDMMAIGVVDAASERGLAVGRDYKVIGFDDSKSNTRDISTMRPPLEELGAKAAELAADAAAGRHSVQQICLRSHLIVRASTGNGSV
jgi:DNA-binding LacI/PurR family transcriptional regulator